MIKQGNGFRFPLSPRLANSDTTRAARFALLV
jgi:hypothetical protein